MEFNPETLLALGLDFGSPWHLMIILIICLLLFGRRLPDIMRGLGSSVKEFKKGMNHDDKPAAQSPAAIPPPAGATAREATPPAPKPDHPH